MNPVPPATTIRTTPRMPPQARRVSPVDGGRGVTHPPLLCEECAPDHAEAPASPPVRPAEGRPRRAHVPQPVSRRDARVGRARRGRALVLGVRPGRGVPRSSSDGHDHTSLAVGPRARHGAHRLHHLVRATRASSSTSPRAAAATSSRRSSSARASASSAAAPCSSTTSSRSRRRSRRAATPSSA